VTYSHAAVLAQLHDVSLVVRSTVEDRVLRAKAPFRSVEVVRMPRLEQILCLVFSSDLKSNFASQAVTAFGYPFALAFEWYAWRQLRQRILAGEFDVALRLIPMTAVLPSPFAFFLRKGPIPFVIGPINGGLPFVKGFSQASGQKEWVSNLRGLYRFLPFARSTLPQRDSDHSRFVPDLCRVCRLSRQIIFCPRAWDRSEPVQRGFAQSTTRR